MLCGNQALFFKLLVTHGNEKKESRDREEGIGATSQ